MDPGQEKRRDPRVPLVLRVDYPGREKAHKAARALERCRYTYPVFLPHLRGPKDTDFNDLQARAGSMRRQGMNDSEPEASCAWRTLEGAPPG